MKNYANMQTLNGLWDFTFVQAELSDTEICNTAMTDIVIVPGCFDAASKFFGKRGTGIYRREVRCSGKIQLEFQAVGLRARIFWVYTVSCCFTSRCWGISFRTAIFSLSPSQLNGPNVLLLPIFALTCCDVFRKEST